MSKMLIREEQISNITQRQIAAMLREILSDPDRSFELRQSFIGRVKKSIKQKKAGNVKDLKKVLTEEIS